MTEQAKVGEADAGPQVMDRSESRVRPDGTIVLSGREMSGKTTREDFIVAMREYFSVDTYGHFGVRSQALDRISYKMVMNDVFRRKVLEPMYAEEQQRARQKVNEDLSGLNPAQIIELQRERMAEPTTAYATIICRRANRYHDEVIVPRLQL